jgi:hypothetical protein
MVAGIWLVSEAYAENPVYLDKGKNEISVPFEMLASDLILLNPEIETISYFDENLGRRIGYINAFGGLGSNFYLVPGKSYEISVRKETNLRF